MLFTFFTIGNLLWQSTIQRSVLPLVMNNLHHLLPKVCMLFHNLICLFCRLCFLAHCSTIHSIYQHSSWSSILTLLQGPASFLFPWVCHVIGLVSAKESDWLYYYQQGKCKKPRHNQRQTVEVIITQLYVHLKSN